MRDNLEVKSWKLSSNGGFKDHGKEAIIAAIKEPGYSLVLCKTAGDQELHCSWHLMTKRLESKWSAPIAQLSDKLTF